jgi:hypothetical protein
MSDKYNNWFAKILNWFSPGKNFAIVLSKNCARYSCDKETVDKNPKWRRHEETHKKQISELGLLKFYWQYFIDFLKHGYKNNKFEVEARKESEKK